MVAAVVAEPATAALPPAERAMVDFALRLTDHPAAITRDDVDALRRAGWDDVAIHDIVQVTALFAYYNRLVDGLGVDPEPEW